MEKQMTEENFITVEVEFEAMLRQPDMNIGGVGGFDMTHVVTTARGTHFIDVFEDENVKTRLTNVLRANLGSVELIEVRVLKINNEIEWV
jgi:hypothetical protein